MRTALAHHCYLSVTKLNYSDTTILDYLTVVVLLCFCVSSVSLYDIYEVILGIINYLDCETCSLPQSRVAHIDILVNYNKLNSQ